MGSEMCIRDSKTIGETTQERTAFEISITCLAFPEELPQETDLR